MSTGKSVWRVACSLCIVIIAIVTVQMYSTHLFLPGILTPTITTDKDSYHVGEKIHARFSLENTNSWAVTFSPPNSYAGMSGSYEGESSPYGVQVYANYVSSTSVVPAGESFTMDRQIFTVDRVGNFTIWCGSASKTVEVMP